MNKLSSQPEGERTHLVVQQPNDGGEHKRAGSTHRRSERGASFPWPEPRPDQGEPENNGNVLGAKNHECVQHRVFVGQVVDREEQLLI